MICFYFKNQKLQYVSRQLLPLDFLLCGLNQYQTLILYKKKLYKNSETETTEKTRTIQEQIEYGILKQNCVCFRNKQRLLGLPSKSSIKFCSTKSKLSIYLNFSSLTIFSMKFYTTIQAFGTGISFKIYSAVLWYNL